MYLRRLELRDFRNWACLDLTLPEGMVIFHGANGAGKTNLLESVCLAAAGDSPRAHESQEMIRLGEDVAFVRTDFHGTEHRPRLEVGLARSGQKQLKINGAPKRRSDLIGLAPVVYFSADDIAIIKGEPGARRRLLDIEISAISQSYYFEMNRYRRSAEQRNRLLKDIRAGRARPDSLDPWDRSLAKHGAAVTLKRHEFISALAPESATAHGLLTGHASDFSVAYRPSVGPLELQGTGTHVEDSSSLVENNAIHLEARLREERGSDILRGSTGSGPHRDDIEVLLRGEPVRLFGSQGEQRTCAVALRIGLTSVVRAATGDRPVLLLDDVLSELDARYRAGVFAACGQAQQVIITCCDPADIPSQARESAASFEVRDGRLV
jgi:DNA replication and repair protein RecF